MLVMDLPFPAILCILLQSDSSSDEILMALPFPSVFSEKTPVPIHLLESNYFNKLSSHALTEHWGTICIVSNVILQKQQL